MFDNVPEGLENYVRGLRSSIRDPQRRYINAARAVAEHYIQFTSRDRTTAEFLGHYRKGSQMYEALAKILMVGETVFLVRNCQGFPEFCQRIPGRDFRATFYELIVARTFLMNGYDIRLVVPTQTKGQDFDFVASRSDEVVNVEVTTSDVEEFSEDTLLNTLGKKRGQLPNTHPAIIVYIVPDSWLVWGNVKPDRFEKVGAEFLRSTGRINAVTFMAEIPRKFPDSGIGGMIAIGSHSYFNPKPRIPWPHGDILGGKKLDAELSNIVFETNDDSELIKLRDNEFYKWVDSLTSG